MGGAGGVVAGDVAGCTTVLRSANISTLIIGMLNYGWQHDSAMWNRIPSSLRGSTSWRSVEFTENEAVSIPDSQPGIYFVCTSPAGRRLSIQRQATDLFATLFAPIYIGRTDNLQRRFLEHCRHPSTKLRTARLCFGASMQFWFHRLPPEELRDTEAILLACFGPTANERQERVRVIVKDPISIGLHDD